MVKFGQLFHHFSLHKMKKRIFFLILYALFWLLFFTVCKILFLIYQLDLSADYFIKVWFAILLHGFKLDLSMTSYVLILPMLGSVIHYFVRGAWYFSFIRFYTLFLLIIFSLLVVVDMELYTHWGFRLDKTPLMYIGTPKEMMASTELWTTVRQLALALILVLAADILFRKFVLKRVEGLQRRRWLNSGILLFLTASLIIPIRGGFGIAPLNPGSAYFHQDPFVNHAGINVVWNFMASVVNAQPLKNKYDFMENEKADKLVADLYKSSGMPVKVINPNQPNIILVVVESLTSKIIEPLGGKEGITPEFNRLVREGILFSNVYATGNRTHKGITGLLSGYPAQPTFSIMKIAKKNETLPNLTRELDSYGYSTAYYYGGSIDFANFRSYLVYSGFDRIVSMDDFDPSTYNSKWGVHDHILLERYLQDLDTATSPFFHIILTLSSHEPFEVPMETVIPGNDLSSKFLNSAYYTDRSLGQFIRAAKEKKWWEKTLIIIISDHGARYPNLTKVHDPDRFQIPMLWLGGALQVKDTIINTYASQTDLPVTILRQLDIESDYPFSKDLFDPGTQSFAFYAFNDGFGFMTDTMKIVFDNVSNRYIVTEGVVPGNEPEIGKAYLQVTFEDFVSR